ncbi:5-formyltetrahydrofolate cyclo-ligase [Akkermansiaceae bacterium]|nr:5-formyltetrahydrofolate cyclo-ligase [Akkermansiaceae bacterium]
MSKEASDNKQQIRSEMRQRLRNLSAEEKKAASQNIREQISRLSLTSCAIFAGTSTEPDLLILLKDHPEIKWFLPRVNSTSKGEMEFIKINSQTELKKGAYGILEPSGQPTSSDKIETIICPGIAFTKNGSRLGQGGGFYDRHLSKAPHIKTIGAFFNCQLVDDLPSEQHDIQMSQILFA